MKIIYFSWLKETLGASKENFDLPSNIKNVDNLIKWLSTKSMKHKRIFLKSRNIRCSINHQIVTNKNSKIKNSDEIAFFPPFTGG